MVSHLSKGIKLVPYVQYEIAILNTGSLFGRSTSGLMAHYFGVPNYMLISVVAISALVLAMLGLHHTFTVALFGVLYGWFSGACKSISTQNSFTTHEERTILGLAMQSPMLAMLAQSPTEVGYVFPRPDQTGSISLPSEHELE